MIKRIKWGYDESYNILVMDFPVEDVLYRL